MGDTGQVFIVDKKGNLIAHKEPERVRAHSNFSNLPVVRDFITQQAIASSKDWREYSDERGESVVALYQVIARLGWAVVIQISSDEVYAPLRSMYRTVVFLDTFLERRISVFRISFSRAHCPSVAAVADRNGTDCSGKTGYIA